MDRQAALRCFCRVVETGSFAAAARDLDWSRSVVTKCVQSLEEWTGARLLERTTRAMQLTEAGEQFYAYARRVLCDTESMLGAMRGAQEAVSGRVVVAAPVSLTLSFLAAHLHAFQAEHPGVVLELRLNDELVDLVREGVDVALRGAGALDDSSLVAQPLMQLDRLVCASPRYWQEHGRPAHPRDLAQHACLPYLLGSDARRWVLEGADGRHEVDVSGPFRTDNSLLLVDALLRDRGVGLVPRPMVASHLASGALEAALADYHIEPRQLYAVYPSRQHLPQRVRALVQFLRGRLAVDAGELSTGCSSAA